MSEVAHPTETKTWSFTVVRAHGLQHLRAESSYRPIVTVRVGDHQCRELNLGNDGQNPNLKQCFQFYDVDASSRIDICIYHQMRKKTSKKRNLVASACCTLQELTRLQARQRDKRTSVEIKLNCVSRQKHVSKHIPIVLVARLDIPEVCRVQSRCVQEDTASDVLSEGPEEQGCSNSSTSDLNEGSTLGWQEEPEHHLGPKVHTGYWSDSDGIRSENERDPLLKHGDDEPILVPRRLSDDENNIHVKNTDYKLWFAASLLPVHTETILSIDSQISNIDSIVDSFSPYRELREANVDSEYERILTNLCAEWRFVGGSLVALSGLEAGVFGFSSASVFTISKFARRAIAVGSIASGIGLAIDAWFLLVYCNVTPVKFQKMARDVYGKYLFFCISARIPAVCMFTSALALMIFLLSVAWSAWPTAVLVMSFLAGVLVSLQFIVYGMHCVVVLIVEVMRSIRKGIMRCITWVRPLPPDVREKPHTEVR